MRQRWYQRLLPTPSKKSWIRSAVSGSLYRISDMRTNTSIADIRTQIDTVRELAKDSQISTALSYYATDATTHNTNGDIIWASPVDKHHSDVADIVNQLLRRWQVNRYARDHILELATVGNLYLPTSQFYGKDAGKSSKGKMALDNNTILDEEFDIVPSSMIQPEDVAHLWFRGKPEGYIYQPEDGQSNYVLFPESSIIHFSLGGLLGKYTLDTVGADGETKTYDIQFAEPLMSRAIQPTQTLSLLEDAIVLSSLTRTVRFINVDCGDAAEEDEVRDTLQQIKDMVEQQLAINTSTGDAQSFVNPQSPNNLIYVPKINGNDPISVTDLNMAEANQEDSNLLNYYQDKKLSVLGVPKEAMNFSSSEGLGGAGQVMSQRSAIYANSLERLETAYKEGWRDAINKYFMVKNLSGYCDQFELRMQPIVTLQSTIQFEKRDAALNQAQSIIDVLNSLDVTDKDSYRSALQEILTEVLPQIGSDVVRWDIEPGSGSEGGTPNGF